MAGPHIWSRGADVLEAAEVVAEAIAEHYGKQIDPLAVLGGLTYVAADIIRQCPIEDQKILLEAWDESPTFVRLTVRDGH